MLIFVFVTVVNECVQDHLHDQEHVDLRFSHLEEWNHQVEDQPHVHHLDVRCLGKILGHGDEHGGQDEHHGQVDRDDGLEEEGLEVVGHVRDGDEEQGGDVHSEDGAQQSPGEYLHVQMNRLLSLSKNLPRTTSTSMLPPEARLMLVCLRINRCDWLRLCTKQ